ncbi:hypothetical protein [Jiella mangrovi]|uniref:Sulfotransferase family protein n=1 Tax=Jiella mangrovi TaxID=2821407 RepID=A0ABS4BIM0_9HYPH|nr:hypothetical protein [Jiella mangrovi]MBP0616604.1 hypothetical protein [Jiella mangrovi]
MTRSTHPLPEGPASWAEAKEGLDPFWAAAVAAARKLAQEAGGMSIAVPKALAGRIPGGVPYGTDADAVLLHKGEMHLVPLAMLRRIAGWDPVFANPVFVLYAAKEPGRGFLSSLLPGRKRSHVKVVEAHLADVERRRFTGRQQTVLIHVPKTAGTALIHAVNRGSLVRTLHLGDSSREMKTAHEHLPAYDFIAGHVGFNRMRDHLPEAHYVSVLRDPLDRLVSLAGHARRVDRADHLSRAMQMLRAMSLREWFDRGEAEPELFIASSYLTGHKRPSRDLLSERLERIDVATMEGLPQFLRRNADALGIVSDELAPANVTENRATLVPQAEVEELVATHGELIEEARMLYRLVRERERARDGEAVSRDRALLRG